jgi:hypothetical protein
MSGAPDTWSLTRTGHPGSIAPDALRPYSRPVSSPTNIFRPEPSSSPIARPVLSNGTSIALSDVCAPVEE